jgi:hypothetical protein
MRKGGKNALIARFLGPNGSEQVQGEIEYVSQP